MVIRDPRIVDLDALLEAVNDQKSFVEFIGALGRDFALERELEAGKPIPYCAGLLGWENGSIDQFFRVASAFGDSAELSFWLSEDANPWLRCATILYQGKVRE